MEARMARWTLALAAAALAAGLAWAAAPPAVLPALSATAEPLAAKNLLLAGARAGTRLVAVGEHGHVLLSDDQGSTWRQASTVPTVTTLTAVHFIDAKQGWAVGHGGVVIGTRDGGDTWAALAGQLEGPEVLLSVWFRDAEHGLVVGAFGHAASTADGGKTWKPMALAEGEAGERHLNHLFAGAGNTLWVAAESGTLFRSDDGGTQWQALKLPYKGSIWGGTQLEGGALLVWGMRGNLLRSDDGGQTFVAVTSGTDQSLGGALQLPGGALVLAGLGGAVLHSADGGRSFQATVREDRAGHAAVLPGPPGQVVLLGQAGAQLQAVAASAPR
jgi:photosystem II stability/assembly factor-like uncharacterized protein